MASFSQILFCCWKRSTTRLTTTTRSTRRRTQTSESQSGGAQKTQLVMQRFRGKSLFIYFFKKPRTRTFALAGWGSATRTITSWRQRRARGRSKKTRKRRFNLSNILQSLFYREIAPVGAEVTIYNNKFARIIFLRQFLGKKRCVVPTVSENTFRAAGFESAREIYAKIKK